MVAPGTGLTGSVKDLCRTGTKANRLLVVEDDAALLELIRCYFAQKGMEIDLAINGREALEKLSSRYYDMVFTDLHVPVMGGLSLLEWIKKRYPSTKVVVMSGDDTPGNIIMAMRCGALDYLLKPFPLSDLLEIAERCSRRIEPASQAALVSLVRQLTQDLRGDLVNLGMMASLLERGHYGELQTSVEEQLGKIKRKMQAMTEVLEDYGKIAMLVGQGRMLAEEELDLRRDVISPILNELALEIARKEIKVTSNPAQETFEHVMIRGNRVLLRSAFRSLLRAAMRHCNDEGHISFGVSYNGRRFMVNVGDDGPALPEKQRAGLFEDSLFSGDEADQGIEGSLGTGLFLARNIVRQHGGDLWYESRDNDSKFILTLPANG